MATNETQSYDTEKLIAGEIVTRDDAPILADTYYRGEPLEFLPIVTPDVGNTGDGTVVVQSPQHLTPIITVEMTAALVAKLVVNGVDVLTGIALPDGGSVTIAYDGLELILTDGAIAFVVGDEFVVDFASGLYSYTVTNIQAVYLGENGRVIATDGIASIIDSGEVCEDGLVDDSGVALTVTESMKQTAKENGIYIK